MSKNKKNNLFEVMKQHVISNKKEYFIITLLFLLGIFLGVLFINNTKESQITDITNYLNEFIAKFKNLENIDYMELLKNSVLQNIILASALWFFGTTVIGIPVVFGLVLYRGFCLGYTISTCVIIMGMPKGIAFILILLLLQNIIFIPSVLALAVSGLKLYKSIIKDRHKDNIKIEVIRHTIFSLIMMILIIVSSLIEIFVSTNCLKIFIKYF